MKLENGQTFPTITAERVGGAAMTLPADLEGEWHAVIFYRGHW